MFTSFANGTIENTVEISEIFYKILTLSSLLRIAYSNIIKKSPKKGINYVFKENKYKDMNLH